MASSTGSRTVLPVPDSGSKGARPSLRPPKEAPNIVVILVDDVGFGAASAFGGPCRTLLAERMAKGGLKYTRFHTTALCSPTRAALLTGRNHHKVGMGGITEIATSAPGYNSIRPNTCATLPEILRLNGYATSQFGKCHEVPVWETSPAGPFDHWPTGSGFQHFFGFIGGETNQYYPTIYEGTTAVTPNKTPEEGYHFMTDMTDRAINWVKQQKSLIPVQPFFLYFAPGATHAPHHVPAEWADKYKGQFDQGWDRLREEIFKRQKALGVIPEDCVLTARHDEIPAWSEMPEELRSVLSRQMEIYAGFLEFADYHAGRLIETIEALGELDNTLVFYILGDNGASAEGTLKGTFNEYILFNGLANIETDEFLKSRIDEFGTPKAYNHYAVGWAHAMCTPYKWTKQVASHWGGTRNGMVVHWPKGIRSRGEVRSQFSHVTDIASTILEAAGLPEPRQVNGVKQEPMQGKSLRYSFDDKEARERHVTQYFEMLGNRGIYHKGWSAVTKHSTPWSLDKSHLGRFDEDQWELYDGRKDWSQSRDLAGEKPEKLKELKKLWLSEAKKNNVLPLDDRRIERANPDFAGRPILTRANYQILYRGMGRLNENSLINIKNKSHSITAEVTVPKTPANGVLLSQGGSFGGWSFYLKEGRLTYCYNFLGLQLFTVKSKEPLSPGRHQLQMEFIYDGGGLGRGGRVRLYSNGQEVGSGRVERTQSMVFAADEASHVGSSSSGAPVSPEYTREDSEFNGEIDWIKIQVGQDSHDHLVRPKDRTHQILTQQ